MALKKYFVIALVAITVMVLSVGSPITVAQESSPESSPGFHTGWMEEVCNNITYNRTYEYYIPSSYDGSEAVPMLFSFHGLGSNPEGQIELTEFDALAEQEGFIAVFPKATALDPETYPACAQYLPELPGAEIMWNIGMNWTLQYCAGIDDVEFTSDMVDWFKGNYNIDENRIYVTGMSNGAMFSYYVALMLPDTFAGVAPVCSPMTLNGFGMNIDPLTVIMMMGTSDPIVNYDGLAGAYGSMNETVDFWLDINGIPLETEPMETTWGPTGSDSTVVHRYVYGGGTGGTEVIFFEVEGGGHTWPGGPLYSPYVGKVTTHIDGSALIWKHLPPEKYYVKISSTIGGSVTNPGEKIFFYNADISPTIIDLVAEPSNIGYEFVNWTGDVSTIADINAATTTITVQPNSDYEITANFQLKEDEEEEPPSGFCFIATAAYGTSTAKQLDVLRDFRDEVLLKSTVGSRLVDLYYQISPPIADFVSQHSFVRTLAREFLIDPIVWVVEATGNVWQN
jgi:polyhydroxybutyrate depolymerase